LGKRAQDILMKGEAVPEGLVAKMIDDKINSPEVAHHGYVLEGFPCESDSGYDIGKQMEMLKNWKLQPDFIINLRVSFLKLKIDIFFIKRLLKSFFYYD
jgi:adenylate/nucleoside-diphosphate kinase